MFSFLTTLVTLGVAYMAGRRQNRMQRQQITNAAEQAQAQADYDKREAEAAQEEIAADIAATEEKARQDAARVAAAEQSEADRLAFEQKIRDDQTQQEEERFGSESRSAWASYNLEVERLRREADVAALQAEEEIDASRMRTEQAQVDISKHEELVLAAQTAGFAARGIAPGSLSASAVMKRSADQAEAERLKLQENFDLFATTRRTEARRVRESGQLSAEQLGKRIQLAEKEGSLGLRHMRERGDMAAAAGAFSLAQFRAANSRELEFASTFLDMDIAAARRKGDKADRAIAAIEENEQYVQTGFGLQSEATGYAQKYNALGMVTGIAGAAFDTVGKLGRPKTPFFTNYGAFGGGPSYTPSSSGYIE
ncbi:MAG: hypothetical protein GY820_17025 [Gammaproteobacteria bacterium]|nr:hypothetical protein [Gammaproteobacteria bacterium]